MSSAPPSSTFLSDVRRLWKRGDSDSKNEVTVWLAPYTCALIVMVLNLAFYSKAAPTLRLVELTVCREYYQKHDPTQIGNGGWIDESECKAAEIQKKVAWLFMADELLHFCCDFIATIPLGIVADRFGPKPVMILNFSGLILSWVWLIIVCIFYDTFRSEAILVASVFCLFGGATHFNTAIIYSEAALYTKDRTTTFSLLEGTIQICQLVGPIIGSSLLFLSVWSPFYFIFPIAITSIPLALLLPSKEHIKGKAVKRRRSDAGAASAQSQEAEGLLDEDRRRSEETTTADRVQNNDTIVGGNDSRPSSHQSMQNAAISTIRRDFLRFWSLLVNYRMVQFAYASALVVTLGKQALHILLQYVSKRFGMKIAEAGYLFSIKAAVVLILYVFVLPAAQRTLKGPEAFVATRLTRVSILLLALGILITGLAWNVGVMIPGLIIYSAGFGFPILVRSLLSSFAASLDLPIPMLFSGMAIAETAGSFVGATALTTAFTKTLDQEGFAQGAPFYLCSVFYAIILIPTWFAKLV